MSGLDNLLNVNIDVNKLSHRRDDAASAAAKKLGNELDADYADESLASYTALPPKETSEAIGSNDESNDAGETGSDDALFGDDENDFRGDFGTEDPDVPLINLVDDEGEEGEGEDPSALAAEADKLAEEARAAAEEAHDVLASHDSIETMYAAANANDEAEEAEVAAQKAKAAAQNGSLDEVKAALGAAKQAAEKAKSFAADAKKNAAETPKVVDPLETEEAKKQAEAQRIAEEKKAAEAKKKNKSPLNSNSNQGLGRPNGKPANQQGNGSPAPSGNGKPAPQGNGKPQPTDMPLAEILNQSAQKVGLKYAEVLGFIKNVDISAVKSLATKYNPIDCSDDCDTFAQFLSTVMQAASQRPLSIILAEIIAYLKKNANKTFSAIDIINYCNEIYNQVSNGNVFVLRGFGYTKMRIMVENAFIIEYLTSAGISGDLKVGNGVDDSVDTVVQLAVAVAYSMYGTALGDIAEKYNVAFQRIQSDRPEMLNVVREGDYEAFYNMLRTFCGSSTVGIDLRDIDLNMDSYKPGEAAALYAAIIAKMDELAAKYHKSYGNEDVERIVDSMVSRGYRASQTNAIEYYCEELMNPKKPVNARNDKDIINVDNGMNFATRAYIPAGYGLSKSHIEISKPYTEVFGIPFINIRHPLFKAIAMKYTTKYSKKKATKGKTSAMDKAWEKRVKTVEEKADKAEKQLIKEIKSGSLMSKFLVGDQTKETQISGEGLDLMSSIEKGLRKVTSFASNSILVKNILKLIKMAMDGDETPVSRNTLVVAASPRNAYEMNPIVSNMVNDQFANVRVFNPVKPEKSAAVSKKYLKQFYDIINPLQNADEYIACGAFSPQIPYGVDGKAMFRAQLQTVSGGAINPSAVSDAAIAAFRQDIMDHGGYPYTYVLSDQFTGENNQVYKIARNNNFLGNLFRMDVDLVAIHVKKAGMDGIFIMENHDAEVLFS